MEMKQQAQELYLKENKMKKNQQFWRVMDDTELSLAPSTQSKNSSSYESETDSPKKRKYYWDDVKKEPSFTSLELQLKDPLPLDWEQCLDLQMEAAAVALSLLEGSKKQNSSSSSTMFAVACLKCHLLVMLCKSSPSFPNCKYVNPLPTQQSPRPKTSTPSTHSVS
ncbi:hypothetical protein MKX01_033570 [Papaver californicum]|nr:hypothetical protein MKX01_033570 [Papaver californicum]